MRKGRFFKLRHRHQTVISGVGTLNVGRRTDCDIVLRDRMVSRVHARIIVGAETAAIEDLGSANGVEVNGQRIRGLQRLAARDKIVIGEQEIEVLGFDDGVVEDEESTQMRRLASMLPNYSDEEAQVSTRLTELPGALKPKR